MKNSLPYYLLPLAVILSVSVKAQVLPIKHFSANDEYLPLPSESIYALYEDEFGYIWMSAYGAGIVRYNGKEMQLFDDQQGVPKLVVKMFQDQIGRLWVFARDNIVVSTEPLDSDHLDSLEFSSIIDGIPLLHDFPFINNCIDTEGKIWVSDNSALVRYAYNNDGKLTVDTLLRTNTDAFPQQISEPFSKRDGSVWGTLVPSGLTVRLDKRLDGSVFSDTLQMPSPQSPLKLKFEDTQGGLWASNGQSYMYLPPEAERQSRPIVTEWLKTRLRHLVQWSDSSVLGAVVGEGLMEFSTQNGKIIKKYSLEEGLPTTGLLDLIIDSRKNLWIGHTSGLVRIPVDFGAFGAFIAEPQGEKPPALPEAGVNVTLTGWPESKGFSLAGTSRGLAMISERGEIEWLGHEGELLSAIVLGLTTDAENRLWISSTVKGMNCLFPSGKSGNFPFGPGTSTVSIFGKKYQLARLSSGYLYYPQVISIPSEKDSHVFEESLWGVTREKANCLYKGRWLKLSSRNDYLPGTPLCMTHDSSGTIFIGGSKGLIRTQKPMTGSFIQEMLDEGEKDASKLEDTYAVGSVFSPIPLIWEKDTFTNASALLWKNGHLWVGVSGGMLILSGETLKPVAFVSLEGLDAGCMTVSPRSGHIWIGSNSGLFEVNSQSFEVLRRVRKADGLINETNWGSEVLSAGSEGTLYYGTPEGLMVYKPWLDLPDSADFPVYIQNFDYQEDIWGKNELKIKYAALAFRDESSVRYRTRLVGYDQDWSEEKKETSLRYTNLPASFASKTYTFEVQAKDYRGKWISVEKLHTIKVNPPLWLRWWAFIIYSLILVGLAQLYAQWRLKEKLRTLALKEAEIIRDQRDEIQKQNAEKELLLKEIHHRVKNNLQTVSSLLNLQSEHIDDEAAREAVAAGQHRVQSMALIHQKLYQRENLAAIEMKEYLGQLGEGLLESFGVYDDQVQFKIEMEELELDVDSAIPIGLIVNELLTNSLKYAFPEEQKGEIVLSMNIEGEKSLSMTLADNGVGASEEADARGTSFGSQLIKLLTRQLGGKREVLQMDGFGVQFVFTRFKAL